jgi:glycosyltransferase involved in cell wall biosynthesis
VTILHLTPSYKPAYVYGGPIVSIAQLAEAQVALGHSVQVACTRANGATELLLAQDTIAGVAVRYFPRWTGDHTHFSPALLWHIFRQAREYDVVHLHSWWNLVSIPAVLLLWLRGVRPVLSPRGMLSPYTLQHSGSKQLFQRWLGAWLLSKTLLHATSAQELSEAQALVPSWSNFVLPNIVALPRPGQYMPNARTDSPFCLVYLSRIHPKKGLETLFEALPKLDFAWHLNIVGTGEPAYIAQLQKLAQDRGIAERISWLGWREGDVKFQCLAEADLFVLPSQNENFANAALEALAVGTPVLLSAQVGLSAYVQEQALGWVYAGTSEDLLQQLQIAYTDPAQRAAIRERASRRVQVDFGAEELAARYVEAYQGLIQ